MWDPETYLTYADDRARPFTDLVARVRATAPRLVVDLGCGPGGLTRTLADRWPGARIIGIDSSPEMIERAATYELPDRCTFERADLRTWTPPAPVDVIVTNAALQWVPEHVQLLPRWLEWLPSGGEFAMQVPGNFDAPSHALMRAVADDPRWRSKVAGVFERTLAVATPDGYLTAFLGGDVSCTADVWETTYLHVLGGADAVLGWVRGTGLRPVLKALGGADSDDGRAYLAEYGARLRAAYPRGAYGTVLPFRRIFAVARRTS